MVGDIDAGAKTFYACACADDVYDDDDATVKAAEPALERSDDLPQLKAPFCILYYFTTLQRERKKWRLSIVFQKRIQSRNNKKIQLTETIESI